ncbi:MAG: glycosyltransferase family 39 protein [Thiobacillus sp.]|nr:glycosyltransferase family 39 protein [Thiobacillus sp.]
MTMTSARPLLRLPSLIDPASSPARPWAASDAIILAGLLLFALALRMALFNGFFGSDDLVYLARSLQIAEGVWSSANYNGSLRYGYNIPAALFIQSFGLNTFTANAWTLFCSLAEVAVVYLFAVRFLNRRTAIFAALILSSMPLHIALGTRIHADAVLGLFLTLSFALFYAAEQTGKRMLYLATGLALGMIFWVKELAVITLLAFATYPLMAGRLKPEWGWVIAGGLVMLAGHLLLMYAIAGNPLHLITTVSSQLERGMTTDSYNDSAGYYFHYLFVNIRHTWIAPFLALSALVALLFHSGRQQANGIVLYLAWWLLALLIVMSFTPVSFDPLRLTMKQSNYLNLFMAPLALLGGWALAGMRGRVLSMTLLGLTLAGGIMLAALSQHAYRLFTANSKAAVDFVKTHPDDWIIGSTNNRNMLRVAAILERNPQLEAHFDTLDRAFAGEVPGARPPHTEGYVIFDRETLDWGRTTPIPATPPVCWKPVALLVPDNRGAGYWLLAAAIRVSQILPSALEQRVEPALRSYLEPRPATIYRVAADNLRCDAPSLAPGWRPDGLTQIPR